jgi:hypothetical protein
MREFGQREWAGALGQLTETSPLYPFKQLFTAGLRGVSSHQHTLTDAAVVRAFPTEPLRGCSPAEMSALIQFLADTTGCQAHTHAAQYQVSEKPMSTGQ